MIIKKRISFCTLLRLVKKTTKGDKKIKGGEYAKNGGVFAWNNFKKQKSAAAFASIMLRGKNLKQE